MTHVKVCCIASAAEADMAMEAGADALGLVSAMPSGPGVIDEQLIVRISEHIGTTRKIAGGAVRRVLLTSLTDPVEIADQCARCGVDVVQLVDRLADGAHGTLRQLTDLKLVQVIHVADEQSVLEAASIGSQVDALLLDSGNQSLAVKELGGTGRTHDWSLSARIVAAAPVPVLLAGGLRPENVASAVRAVRPAAVDVCSGVRTDGQLDSAKLMEFMEAVRSVG